MNAQRGRKTPQPAPTTLRELVKTDVAFTELDQMWTELDPLVGFFLKPAPTSSVSKWGATTFYQKVEVALNKATGSWLKDCWNNYSNKR